METPIGGGHRVLSLTDFLRVVNSASSFFAPKHERAVENYGTKRNIHLQIQQQSRPQIKLPQIDSRNSPPSGIFRRTQGSSNWYSRSTSKRAATAYAFGPVRDQRVPYKTIRRKCWPTDFVCLRCEREVEHALCNWATYRAAEQGGDFVDCHHLVKVGICFSSVSNWPAT
jgi:hypothetical protein